MASSTQKHYNRKALRGETRTITTVELCVYKKELDWDSHPGGQGEGIAEERYSRDP